MENDNKFETKNNYKFFFNVRCIDLVKNSSYANLAHDLEIQKALVYLKAKNFNMAIETLKDFERRDVKVASSAATNLSFLYFLENDLKNSNKYADLSLAADKYNPAGNILFINKTIF
jgi:intraflagellar transport protein 88